MIRWQTRLNQVPLEAWTFVMAAGEPYGLFLSLRPDTQWRGFVLAKARCNADLLNVRWSADVFAEHFVTFGQEELAAAQERLVSILAQRLGIEAAAVTPARNGRKEERRMTTAQVQQVAQMQPRRR